MQILFSVINALKSRAYIYTMLGEYERAFADFDYVDYLIAKNLKLSHLSQIYQTVEPEFRIEQADINMRRGWIYKTKGDMKYAIRYCRKSMMLVNRWSNHLRFVQQSSNPFADILKKVSADSVKAGIYNTLGAIYADSGDYQKAICNFKKLYSISKKMNDKSAMGDASLNLGFVYENLGDYDRALNFLKLALSFTKISGDKNNEGMVNNNLGYIYYLKCNYKKAIDYYFKFLQISLKTGSRLGKALALNNLGCTYLQIGNFEKARTYLQDAENLFAEIDDRYTLIETYLFLAELSIADTTLEPNNAVRIRNALKYLCKALRLASELRSTYRTAGCCLTSARIYYAAGDFKKAQKDYERAIHLFRSIGQIRDLLDAYLGYAKLLSTLPVCKRRRFKTRQEQCIAQARRLCKKLKIRKLEKLCGLV